MTENSVTLILSGGMDEDETVSLFQELIDSRLAWQLQGCYGRMAQRLIEDGLCRPKKIA